MLTAAWERIKGDEETDEDACCCCDFGVSDTTLSATGTDWSTPSTETSIGDASPLCADLSTGVESVLTAVVSVCVCVRACA